MSMILSTTVGQKSSLGARLLYIPCQEIGRAFQLDVFGSQAEEPD
jgi:hypothetical protein